MWVDFIPKFETPDTLDTAFDVSEKGTVKSFWELIQIMNQKKNRNSAEMVEFYF